MKDAMLTIRLPAQTRRRIEQLARRESRSLSQAAQTLIELGLAAALADRVSEPGPTTDSFSPPGLAGSLVGGLVPTLDDFRSVRQELSASMGRSRAVARARR
jgi:hypothetical protein